MNWKTHKVNKSSIILPEELAEQVVPGGSIGPLDCPHWQLIMSINVVIDHNCWISSVDDDSHWVVLPMTMSVYLHCHSMCLDILQVDILVGPPKAWDVQEDGIVGQDLCPVSAPKAVKVAFPRHVAQLLQEAELHEGHFPAFKLELLIKRWFGDGHDYSSVLHVYATMGASDCCVVTCMHVHAWMMDMCARKMYILNTLLYAHFLTSALSTNSRVHWAPTHKCIDLFFHVAARKKLCWRQSAFTVRPHR